MMALEERQLTHLESGCLLQHLLDTVRTGPDHLRPRGREHQDPVRGR